MNMMIEHQMAMIEQNSNHFRQIQLIEVVVSRDITRNRFSKDFQGKWQHDLYFEDERKSNFRSSTSRQDHRQSNNPNQFLLNDYMFRSSPTQTNYRERTVHIPEKKPSLDRHSLNLRKKPQSRSDDYPSNAIDERIFHRRRNFTNSQYQQDSNVHENSSERNNDNHYYDGKSSKYEISQKTRNLPLRFPENNTSNTERSKRYSHMRNNLTNPSQVQRISSSQNQQFDLFQSSIQEKIFFLRNILRSFR